MSRTDKHAIHNAHFAELRKKIAAADRPYLLDFLERLDVKKCTSKTWTIGRCYNEIDKRLRTALGKPERAPIGNYYRLWAKGIAIDHLKTLTRKEAFQMEQMLNSQTSAEAR